MFPQAPDAERMTKQMYVYILATKKNGTLYIGVTNDLVRRVYQHRENLIDGFTKEYGVHRLVYFEIYDDPERAIQREKTMKRYVRQWKINLIEQDDPDWTDLYESIVT